MTATSSSSTSATAGSSEQPASLNVSATLLPCICAVSCPRHNIAMHDILDNFRALSERANTNASSTLSSASSTPSSLSSSLSSLSSTISSVSTATASTAPPVVHAQDGESIEALWHQLDGLAVEEHVAPDASPMRRSGFLREGEYGEDETPNLSHIAIPAWVVWRGHDGTRWVHGVYPDWGRAGQVTQGVSNARHRRFDSRDTLFAAWRDAHIGANGERAIPLDSTLWPGSLLGRVVTRAELVQRIRSHALARDVDPDTDAATSTMVAGILLDALITPAQPPAPTPRNVAATPDERNEDAGFFVVIRGTDPGLWYSREHYLAALGRNRKRWGYVASSEARANDFLRANEDKIMVL